MQRAHVLFPILLLYRERGTIKSKRCQFDYDRIRFGEKK